MLSFEQSRGQQPALLVPDELTVAHLWKGAKREYAFDSVFTPDASQAQVRASYSPHPNRRPCASASQTVPEAGSLMKRLTFFKLREKCI